ncbi:toll/interleukin-1 receptor domain-containing protein [Fluoribacter gormanii]|uniref:toll/interleukin-1 receptor domain-containing protein n=1 Tax=Fluoribacter gormanii TaxID=464 RepID=UPI0010416C55|nr:toll/interleukin-1 receptor domain-containing protein [Fluoribacter gormanii]
MKFFRSNAAEEQSRLILLKQKYIFKIKSLSNEILDFCFRNPRFLFDSKYQVVLQSLSINSDCLKEIEVFKYSNDNVTQAECFRTIIQASIRRIESVVQSLGGGTSLHHNNLLFSLNNILNLYKKINSLKIEKNSLGKDEISLIKQGLDDLESTDLDDFLHRIRKIILDSGAIFPQIFISYAWPLAQNKNEINVQSFVLKLCTKLREAGIIVYLDQIDSRYGCRIQNHINKIDSSDFVLLIGTPSLKQKYESNSSHMVQDEISAMLSNEKTRIIPIWFNGSIEQAFPRAIIRNLSIEDWTHGDYANSLKKMVLVMCNLNLQDLNKESKFTLS